MNLEKAISIAVTAHANQQDKYGAPYIGHVLRVMNMGITEAEKICGVLHDIVEDTAWTFEALEKEGLDPYILDAVRCLSKLSEDEDYDHFTARVMQNKLAMTVKMHDLTDNMDVRRIPQVTEKDVARLNKYLKAYRTISATLAGL